MKNQASGYFGSDSTLRRIHRERIVALSGPRALLMQAAHPLAVSGLLAHSSALDEPYERLSRTAAVMNTIAFGSRAEADRLSRMVRRMHGQVSGRLSERAGPFPAGTPYRADDPRLLMWVLYTLVDSAVVVYGQFVRPLERDEVAAYWDDYKTIGRLFGLRRGDMPSSLDDLRAYGAEMLAGGSLVVTDWARSRARQIVLEPPVPLRFRPLLELANFVTIGLLPDEIRRQYGFSPLPPAFMRKALTRGAAEYVRRVALPVLPARLRLAPNARRR